jgi:hypothetical protein
MIRNELHFVIVLSLVVLLLFIVLVSVFGITFFTACNGENQLRGVVFTVSLEFQTVQMSRLSLALYVLCFEFGVPFQKVFLDTGKWRTRSSLMQRRSDYSSACDVNISPGDLKPKPKKNHPTTQKHAQHYEQKRDLS